MCVYVYVVYEWFGVLVQPLGTWNRSVWKLNKRVFAIDVVLGKGMWGGLRVVCTFELLTIKTFLFYFFKCPL